MNKHSFTSSSLREFDEKVTGTTFDFGITPEKNQVKKTTEIRSKSQVKLGQTSPSTMVRKSAISTKNRMKTLEIPQ
jgi:hypothetical protein